MRGSQTIRVHDNSLSESCVYSLVILLHLPTPFSPSLRTVYIYISAPRFVHYILHVNHFNCVFLLHYYINIYYIPILYYYVLLLCITTIVLVLVLLLTGGKLELKLNCWHQMKFTTSVTIISCPIVNNSHVLIQNDLKLRNATIS